MSQLGTSYNTISDTHHNTEDTVGSRNDGVSSPSVFGWEQLRGECVEYAIHNIASEAVATIPAQQCVRSTRCGGCKDEDASED